MKLLLLFYMNDKLKLTITAIFFVATMQAQIFEKGGNNGPVY